MYISVDLANIYIMIVMVIVSTIILYTFEGDRKENTKDINSKFSNLLYLNLIFQVFVLIDCVIFTNNASAFMFYAFTFLYIFTGMVLTREYVIFTIHKFTKIDRYIFRYKVITNYSFAFFALLLVIFGFSGGYYEYFDGEYQRGNFYFISILYPILSCLFSSYIAIKREGYKRDKVIFIFHTVVLLFGQFIQVKVVSYSFMAYSYCIVTLLFFVRFYTKAKHDLVKVEEELAEDRLKLIQMQMQPHFMYNALSSIAQLIKTDSKEAYKAINEFTEYLRSNLDSIGKTELVPFEKELRHVQSFAILEKYRFGDRINVVYDIGPKNFYIPALTIEPIVENSLRYGISKREEGGTVILKTVDMDKYIYIYVIDDGDGYEIGKQLDTSRKHLGLDSVKARLEKMVNGELIIDSVIGEGTKVLVKIPKRFNNENISD